MHHTKDCIVNAEHYALRDITGTTQRKYRLVRIDEQTIPGSDVREVVAPTSERPYWSITLVSGSVYKTTHPVTVAENAQ